MMRKTTKRFTALIVAALTIATSGAQAQPYYENYSGYAYANCHRSCCFSPEIAVGAIAVAATVAIILTNRSDNGHSH